MKKKLITITMTVIISASLTIPSAIADTARIDLSSDVNVDELKVTTGSGICGDNMQWTLDDSGTLTISGKGEMYNYVDFADNTVAIPWFENNNALVIKNVVVKDGIESISDMAFYGTSISTLMLPNSVRTIGVSSFANCKNLTVAVLSDNISEISEGAFNCDENLEAVALPDNLKSIGESAFLNCYKLSDIVIPKSVTEIKFNAFSDCISLNEVVIPENIETINSYTFRACEALSKVVFPQNLETVDTSAFSNCGNIEEIILPDGLLDIGQNAFSYSKNDRDTALPKQKVYVPKSVRVIGQNGIDSDSVIYGFKGSMAEKFATENKIDFVEVTESLYNYDSYNTIKTEYYSKPTPTIKESTTSGLAAKPSVSTLTVHSGKTITVSVDSKTVNFPDAQPFVDENNRTQIPVRAVAEMLDCTVDWNKDTETAIITCEDGRAATLTIGSDVMIVNNTETNIPVQMDTAAIIKDERTYIPVRFVAEAMGLTVNWQN